ncbi:MAG: polyphosphate polymerase domain-containing protein [Lachnospiraceae bacterium]|nr:polyphosphate polymerase domain-containing protein [Lachnospiraceae bacterium]
MGHQYIFERTEMKFLLNGRQYRELMNRLKSRFAIDEYGMTKILNIYYDTDDYLMVRRSQEKPAYKEKLRLRCYGIPEGDSAAFIEIKKKYDGVVYKRRAEMPYEKARAFLATEPQNADSQILREVEYMKRLYGSLHPAMTISYSRIAMYGLDDHEQRITFDSDIRYRTRQLDLRNGYGGYGLLGKDEHLMEIKVAGALPMELARLLSSLKIYKTSFSKYGEGYANMMAKEKVLPFGYYPDEQIAYA